MAINLKNLPENLSPEAKAYLESLDVSDGQSSGEADGIVDGNDLRSLGWTELFNQAIAKIPE